MGIPCAPSYTNIFIARFEQKHIYPFIKGKIDFYLRYIDDVFFIWKSTKKELKFLFNRFNKKHPSINFDQKYSKSKKEFLDVLVSKDEQQKLQTTLFMKNTDRQSNLHVKFNHPKKYTVHLNTVCQKNLFNKQRIRAQL